jgi:hypothetical protein
MAPAIDVRAELWHREQVYAPGQSPFHVRGSAYLGVREHADTKLAGGMATLVRALPEGPHRAFASQSFTPEGWYDALPIRPITELLAKLEGRDWEASVRERAEQLAARELGLLGRVRILGGPDKVIEKLVRLAAESFDFGQAEIAESSNSRVRVVLHQVPQPLGSWVLVSLQGHATVMLGKAGARQVEAGGRLIPTGRRDDMGLVEVRLELGWTR